jgi:predicted SnoaL-like aldol condensation-catalyzing enzyme
MNTKTREKMRGSVQRRFRIGLVLLAALAIPLPAVAASPADKAASPADNNVKLVKSFLADVRVATFEHHDPAEIRAVTERYLVGDYIQHSKVMKPGRDGYADSMIQLAQGSGPKLPPMPVPEDLYWIADGDKVVWVSLIKLPGQDSPEFFFNMMRIQDGKIAEHWGK